MDEVRMEHNATSPISTLQQLMLTYIKNICKSTHNLWLKLIYTSVAKDLSLKSPSTLTSLGARTKCLFTITFQPSAFQPSNLIPITSIFPSIFTNHPISNSPHFNSLLILFSRSLSMSSIPPILVNCTFPSFPIMNCVG